MARLQHLVIYCDDPVKTAEFYEKLGLKRVVEAQELYGAVISLSDGHVNFTLLPAGGEAGRRDGRKPGFDHIGFVVDDVAERSAALEETGASIYHRPVPQAVRESLAALPPRRTEAIYIDPQGVPVELASRPWPA